jgi:hypothetical protein
MKRYTVHVTEQRCFWDVLEVEANSPEEAKELACQAFQPDWVCSHEEDIQMTILHVEEASHA